MGVGDAVTTTQALLDEARADLFSGQEEYANRLNGALTNNATSVVFKYDTTGISPGTIIAVDLEEIRVWEISGTTASVVERGVNGTTAASHDDLAYVSVAPKFSNFRILRAFNEELASLSSPLNGLYQMSTVEFTYNPSVAGNDLAGVTSLDQVWRVEARYSGLPGDWSPVRRWRLDRLSDTGDFASGYGLYLGEGGQPGQPVRVWYRAPFTPLSTTDVTVDVNAASGLPASANDLLPLGAAIRLVLPREVRRNFTDAQGEPRRATEVPPGAVLQSARGLLQLQASRIAEESARLARQFPNRMAGT